MPVVASKGERRVRITIIDGLTEESVVHEMIKPRRRGWQKYRRALTDDVRLGKKGRITTKKSDTNLEYWEKWIALVENYVGDDGRDIMEDPDWKQIVADDHVEHCSMAVDLLFSSIEGDQEDDKSEDPPEPSVSEPPSENSSDIGTSNGG